MPPQGGSVAQARPAQLDGQVLERWRGALRAYAYARVRDREVAEDLVQETMLRAWRALPKLPDPSDAPHYLRRILKNLCVDFWRSQRPMVALRLVGESEEEAARGGTTVSQLIAHAAEEEFLAHDARQRILDAIGELPERLREVLTLRCLEGLSYAEMARFLGVTMDTINWRLYKARQLLAEELQMRVGKPAEGPLSCRQCRRLLSPFIDGELEFGQVRRVHEHLQQCERCSDELERVCEQTLQVDLALTTPGSEVRILRHSSPRVWNRAWELMAERADEVAQDDGETCKAVHAFAVQGLTAQQLGLLLRMAQACVEANPASPEAHNALGRVHIRRRDYQAAQGAFERQIELAARLEDPARAQRAQASGFLGLAWVWDHIARRAEEADGRQAAMAAAERSVEYGSKARDLDATAEPSIQGWLPEWLAFLGREGEALRETQRYLRTMEAAGKRPAYEKVADALDRLGRRQEAVEYFQRWLAATPLDPTALGHLRDAYDSLGRPKEGAFWATRAEVMRKSTGPHPERWLPPA